MASYDEVMSKTERFFAHTGKMLKIIQDATPEDEHWKVSIEDGSGTWCWTRGDDVWIYATPWWEETTGLPVVLCTENHDEGLVTTVLPLDPPTDDPKADADRYMAAFLPFLGTVA